MYLIRPLCIYYISTQGQRNIPCSNRKLREPMLMYGILLNKMTDNQVIKLHFVSKQFNAVYTSILTTCPQFPIPKCT